MPSTVVKSRQPPAPPPQPRLLDGGAEAAAARAQEDGDSVVETFQVLHRKRGDVVIQGNNIPVGTFVGLTVAGLLRRDRGGDMDAVNPTGLAKRTARCDTMRAYSRWNWHRQ